MKKALILVGSCVVVAVAAVVITSWRASSDSFQFAELKNPRLTEMESQKVLVVEATGDPRVTAGPAFRQLFATYYRIDGVSRMSMPPAPRARWQFSVDTPRSDWRGFYALPVPATAALPSGASLDPKIADWQYGAVAEIVHVGSYSSEEPDINRLLEYVRAHGYRTVGEHEEEYVKGPGMIFAGDPEKYVTIIRVRVEKTQDES